MNSKMNWYKTIFTGMLLWTFLLNSLPVKAQTGDIVSSDDISGGSSVFVFRQSRKAPQTKFASRARTPVKRSTAQKATARKNVQSQVAVVAPKREKITKETKVPVNVPVKEASKYQTSIVFGTTAENFLDKNQFDDSISWFRKSIELDDKNQTAKLGLSEALTKKGDDVYEKSGAASAEPFYTEAVKYNANNAGAYAGLGSVYDDLENDDLSFQNYDKALALNPKLTELYAPIGATYYQKGDYVKAEDLLSKAVANRAEDDQTQLLLGMIRYKQGQNDQAIAALQRSISIKETAEAHYYLGEIYDRADRVQDALAEYNKAVMLNPKFTEAWFDLGALNYNRGLYNDSINAYSQAVKLKNDDPEFHENLADVYRQTKDYDKAASEYQLATVFVDRNKPKDMDQQHIADLYSKYGFVLGRKEKWASSIDALNRAVSIKPDNVDYTNIGWAYYNSAQVDLKANNEADAKSKLAQGKNFLEKAVAMNTQSPAAYMNLGLTHTDLGEYQAATEAFKKCVSLRDNWVPAYNELGYAYRMMNDYDNAVQNFKKAADLDGNYYPALYNWGESEYRRGNTKEAKRIQDKLNKVNPYAAKQLGVILSGIDVTTDPKKQVENKINDKNPLKKIPKIPY